MSPAYTKAIRSWLSEGLRSNKGGALHAEAQKTRAPMTLKAVRMEARRLMQLPRMAVALGFWVRNYTQAGSYAVNKTSPLRGPDLDATGRSRHSAVSTHPANRASACAHKNLWLPP